MKNKNKDIIQQDTIKPVEETVFLPPEIKGISWISKSLKAERLKVVINEDGKYTRYSIFAFTNIIRRVKSNGITVKSIDITPIILRNGKLDVLDNYRDDKGIVLIDEKFVPR